MIWLIVSLIFIGFLQESILPLNLIFIALISRAFITDDQNNYYLSFGLGLFLSFLSSLTLGGLSIFYLLAVLLIQIIKRMHLFAHWIVVIPVSLFLLGADQAVRGVLSGSSLGSSIDLSSLVAETIFVLPVFIIVRFWEERFVPRKEIRLKLGR